MSKSAGRGMIQVRIKKRFARTRESAPFELDVDFQSAAATTVLFGPSGSGKTMTLDSIAGFVRPDQGRILLGDAILFDAAAQVHLPAERRNCGYVFQNYALFPHMTVRGNLEFAVGAKPRLERHRRVNETVERFHLAEVAGRKPHELSGGQKQRCSIARALIVEPRLLLLDEPGQGLDATLRAELYNELRAVRANFATPMLLVTHDLAECFELADRMVALHNGRVIQAGTPAEVVERPASLEVASLFGRYCFIPAEISKLDPARHTSVLTARPEGDTELEIDGPYLPSRLRGDHVTIYADPRRLKGMPRQGRPPRNHFPAELDRVIDTPDGVRLEFRNGLRVEMPRAEFQPNAQVREWWVEVPASAIRAI